MAGDSCALPDKFELRRTGPPEPTAGTGGRGRSGTGNSALLKVLARESGPLIQQPPALLKCPAWTEPARKRIEAPEKHEFARCAARELWARAQRARFFRAGLFGDVAWNMLLALYVLGTHRSRVSDARFMRIPGIPRSTALRWLNYLQDHGLIVRSARPAGSGNHLIRLTDKARQSLDCYFARMR
jgi:hypothetical protein